VTKNQKISYKAKSLRFISIARTYPTLQDLATNVNLVELSMDNYNISEGCFAITNFSPPAIAFVSNQLIKTADLEEIENKIISTAKFADEMEKIVGGRADNW